MNTQNNESAGQYMRGLRTGRLEVVQAVRTILEESEQRISILTILATLERLEQEVVEL
jgi:hypothetical protein